MTDWSGSTSGGRGDPPRGDRSAGPSLLDLALILAFIAGIAILAVVVFSSQTSGILNTVSGSV
jgi:hypothetical protein